MLRRSKRRVCFMRCLGKLHTTTTCCKPLASSIWVQKNQLGKHKGKGWCGEPKYKEFTLGSGNTRAQSWIWENMHRKYLCLSSPYLGTCNCCIRYWLDEHLAILVLTFLCKTLPFNDKIHKMKVTASIQWVVSIFPKYWEFEPEEREKLSFPLPCICNWWV